MTCRGGREASKRRGIGEDEEAAGDGETSHLVEAFQFGELVMLKKGNHPVKHK